MENQLQTFTNEQFGTVRTFIKDGEVCFIAADCCAALGIKNYRDALSNFDEDDIRANITARAAAYLPASPLSSNNGAKPSNSTT